MRMKSRWGLAALAVACLAGLNSCAKARNSNFVTQSFMWIATTGDQMVRSYSLQLNNGAVSQTGNAVATGVQPQAMAATPDGQMLFIANTGDSTIGIYTIKSDGTLKLQSAMASSGQQPVALAVDPSGNFLLAADQATGDVSSYKIGSGSLTAMGAAALQTPSPAIPASPSALVVSPAGNYVYVADSVNNTVLALSYDNSGVLTPLLVGGINPGPCPAGYCVQVGTNPSGLAFSRCAGIAAATSLCATPDSNSLFVSNAGSNTISVFSACIQIATPCPTPNGTLTSAGTPVAACCGPTTLMVDPVANFVYVLEPGSAQVGEFRYNPIPGTLTALSPNAASTGAAPFSAGISTNTSNNDWIFVSNAGASSVSGYSITPAGRLAGLSTGPIVVPAQPTAIAIR